jgi:arylformamidase
MLPYRRLIDISQPVKSDTAVYPGDSPFSREIVLSCAAGQIVNLSRLSMSPHVGTHADAPAHIRGDMSGSEGMAGDLPLSPFIGPAFVVDLAPHDGEISWSQVEPHLIALEHRAGAPATRRHFSKNSNEAGRLPALRPEDSDEGGRLPERVLFRTRHKVRYQVFESEYAFFASEMISKLYDCGVRLLGIDAPSVDSLKSQKLEAHHELDRLGMFWLESLDLSDVGAGEYFLIALPIKFMELEASPVRAVLLEF